MKNIYLDYAATTPVAKEVLKAMQPYFRDAYGNPGSLHFFGQRAIAAVDKSREVVAKAIQAEFNEVIFTGSATEANNLALRGVIRAALLFPNGTGRSSAPAAEADLRSRSAGSFRDQARQSSEGFRTETAAPLKVIVSSIEHESVLETARDLEKDGVEVVYLPVSKDGFIDLEKFRLALDERTVLVSVMYANNEIGTIQPILEISKLVKDFNYEILIHTDAVQAFQFLDCNVNRLGVDLMTLSAHKIYGPKGVGALYLRRGVRDRIAPILTGGGQEFGFRSGTENVPSIVGFAKAVELVNHSRELESERIRDLLNYFWKELKKIYPRAERNGGLPAQAGEQVLPNILNVYFPDYLAEDLLIKFDMAGIAVSSGSACRARSVQSSHVIKALGLGEERARRSIRFSFGRFTTKKELTDSFERLKKFFKIDTLLN